MNTKFLLVISLIFAFSFLGCSSTLESLVSDNDIKGVEEKLKEKPDVNAEDSERALRKAVYQENIEIIKLLTSYGIKAKRTIMMAVDKNRLDIIKLLHPIGIPYIFDTNSGMTPLMQAAAVGDIENLKVIYNQGNPDTTRLEVLLYDGKNFDVKPYGHNAFTLAIERGHLEVIKFLLYHGADLQKRFVITEAFTGLSSELIKHEVKTGSTVTIKGLHIIPESYGTPLSYAIFLNNPEVIQLLKEKSKS
jgi:hypothetical protein